DMFMPKRRQMLDDDADACLTVHVNKRKIALFVGRSASVHDKRVFEVLEIRNAFVMMARSREDHAVHAVAADDPAVRHHLRFARRLRADQYIVTRVRSSAADAEEK